MAVSKKQAAEAAESEQASNSMKEEKTAATAENMAAVGETETLVYIGPKLPGGKLKSNRVFIGTRAAIKTELADVLEDYPLVEKLLVPVEQLAEKKSKVQTAGNILNKYYQDTLSTIAAKEQQGSAKQ